MKLVREYINEVFTQDSDPIKDLGIGCPFSKIKKYDIIEINDYSDLDDEDIEKFIKKKFKFHINKELGANYDVNLIGVVYDMHKFKDELNLKLIFVNDLHTVQSIKSKIVYDHSNVRTYTTVEATLTYEDWTKYFKIVKE